LPKKKSSAALTRNFIILVHLKKSQTKNANNYHNMAHAEGPPCTINQIFLPPKLPHKDDSGLEKYSALTDELEAALRSH